MSNLEICDALFADRPKLQIKANSLIPKMAKQFMELIKYVTEYVNATPCWALSGHSINDK